MSIRRIVTLLIGLLAATTISTVSAGELDSRMQKIVRKFAESSQGKEEAQLTLAVFPFQADEKLMKKKVNFAVGELLTHKLLQSGRFKLVERTQLQAILKEQQLGLTGALESETAAKVGRLLGARLAVLGGVSRLSRSYQIVAKLVDVESGEILTSEVHEVPIEVFDAEASPYLVLVPERERLGIYIVGGIGTTSVDNADSEIHFGTVFTPTNSQPSDAYMGVGLRYFPYAKWMLDFSVTSAYLNHSDSIGVTIDDDKWPEPFDRAGNAFRLVFDRAVNLSHWFTAYCGAGIQYIEVAKERIDHDFSTVRVQAFGNAVSRISPLVRLGLEWHPKARIGLAVFGGYYLTEKEAPLTINIMPSGGGPNDVDMTVYRPSFPRFFVEPTLSVYF